MKRSIQTILLSCVALASAHAAQYATINFAFKTPAGEMPAGRYKVEPQQLGSGKYVQLHNVNTRKSVLFHPSNPVTNIRGTEQPRLVFLCGQSGCSLQRIWNSGVDGFEFRQKKGTTAEAERLAIVQLEPKPAE